MDKDMKILTDEVIKKADKVIGDIRGEITKNLFAIFGFVLLMIRNMQGELNLLMTICFIICGFGIGNRIARMVIISRYLSVVKDAKNFGEMLKEDADETD